MDSDGDVLSILTGDRSLEGFDGILKEARKNEKRLVELSKKAKTGDRNARIELLNLRLDLHHLSLASASAEVSELELTAEAKEELDRRIIQLEVREILAPVTGDMEGRIAAGKEFAAMLEKGRIPSDSQDVIAFVVLTLDYAEDAEDVALFEKVLAMAEKELADIPGFVERFLEPKKELLEGMREEKEKGGG